MNTNSARELPKVIVADPLHADGLAALRVWADVTYTPDRNLIRQVEDAQALVVRGAVTEAVLGLMPQLRAIVRCGAGLDGIPQAYAADRGIAVTNTPGANANAVAEYVFASAFQVARDISAYAEALRGGDWHRRSLARSHSFELRGRRLGIVGMGAIGQRLAHMGHFGFDMPVRASVTTPRGLPEYVEAVDIGTLCHTSDVLVLCCSLSNATRGLIGQAQLRGLPAHAILVNVARGAVVDEAALLTFAADPQRSVALVLDVHHTSPMPAGHPLARAHLCWPTPHMAGITADAERRMALATERALARLLEHPVGRPAVASYCRAP